MVSKRFGGCAALALALAVGRVAGPGSRQVIASPSLVRSGVVRVAVDVHRQRLERRDVERVQAVRRIARRAAARLGRNPARVLPPPVGAISRAEQLVLGLPPCMASWWSWGRQPLVREPSARSLRAGQALVGDTAQARRSKAARATAIFAGELRRWRPGSRLVGGSACGRRSASNRRVSRRGRKVLAGDPGLARQWPRRGQRAGRLASSSWQVPERRLRAAGWRSGRRPEPSASLGRDQGRPPRPGESTRASQRPGRWCGCRRPGSLSVP